MTLHFRHLSATGNTTARNSKPTDYEQCRKMGKRHVGRTAIQLRNCSIVYHMHNAFANVWLTQMDFFF